MKSTITACVAALALGPMAAWPHDSTASGQHGWSGTTPARWPHRHLSESGAGQSLEARVAALEAAIVEAPSALSVSCPGDSLADAVARAVPGTPLTITVSGRCAEALVLVNRDDITIEGASRADGLDGQLRIVGAQRVVVRNLTVENLDGTAVNIRESASVTLQDVTAVGDLVSAPNSGNDGYGVAITRQAHAQLTRVDAKVLAGGNNALLLADGASARAVDGSFISHSDTRSDNTAIGLYRMASLRMDGRPLIENRNTLGGPEPTASLAIQVAHTSNFRIDDEIDHIRGTVQILNNSAARIRRLGGPGSGPGTLDGSVLIGWDSSLELGTRLAATVNGIVDLGDQSLLIAQGPFASIVVSGGVFCGGLDPDAGIVNSGSLASLPPASGCKLF